MSARDEIIAVVLPVLEKCFDSDWNMTYSEMVADALIADGFRKVFDGDCGLSTIKDPTEREAAEAWMRWANIVSGNDGNGIAAMQRMLTEFGYRKPRTITTAEELDALPAEAVVRSSVGVVWEKYAYEHDDDYEDEDDFWQQVGLQRMYASSKITLPATVLHDPEATA